MLLAWLSASFQSRLPLPTSKLGPFGADSQVGGLCMFQNPVGLSNELSCEAGNFSQRLNPHRFYQSEVLRLYFPTLETWIVQSVSHPSCSSLFICTQMWDHLFHQLPPCLKSSLSQLPVSASPPGVDECFFSNSLVVRLLLSLIFCHFLLFFLLKFIVVLLFLVQGLTACLPKPPSKNKYLDVVKIVWFIFINILAFLK